MHLFPDAFVSPTGESFIDTVPIPIFGRKQPPLGAGAVNPQNGLDKPLAIPFLTDVQAGAATGRCSHGPVQPRKKSRILSHCSAGNLTFDIQASDQNVNTT